MFFALYFRLHFFCILVLHFFCILFSVAFFLHSGFAFFCILNLVEDGSAFSYCLFFGAKLPSFGILFALRVVCHAAFAVCCWATCLSCNPHAGSLIAFILILHVFYLYSTARALLFRTRNNSWALQSVALNSMSQPFRIFNANFSYS